MRSCLARCLCWGNVTHSCLFAIPACWLLSNDFHSFSHMELQTQRHLQFPVIKASLMLAKNTLADEESSALPLDSYLAVQAVLKTKLSDYQLLKTLEVSLSCTHHEMSVLLVDTLSPCSVQRPGFFILWLPEPSRAEVLSQDDHWTHVEASELTPGSHPRLWPNRYVVWSLLWDFLKRW